jgi:hypothetical protein
VIEIRPAAVNPLIPDCDHTLMSGFRDVECRGDVSPLLVSYSLGIADETVFCLFLGSRRILMTVTHDNTSATQRVAFFFAALINWAHSHWR